MTYLTHQTKIRRQTTVVKIGRISVGTGHPIIVQSMTDTPTSDIPSTLKQTIQLIDAGSEMVRWTVNDSRGAKAVPGIIRMLRDKGYTTPIIGDFHFNGHLLLKEYPSCAKALSKYRINPGNVGRKRQHDQNFATIIKVAIQHNKPVRIGVNSGSLDPEVISRLMDKNTRSRKPKLPHEIMCEAMIESALQSSEYAQKLGLKKDKIILSVKMSSVSDMIRVNRQLAAKCNLPIHLGLTEAGSDTLGISSSAVALGILLNEGIGDTIRVSLTPNPGIPRTREVEVCQAVLQSLGLRYFKPTVISCPGCGRTDKNAFQTLTQDIHKAIESKLSSWKIQYRGIEKLRIAIMGCVVNGPGESRQADIGISLPGIAEDPIAPVYIKGKKVCVLQGKKLKDQFIRILEKHLSEDYGRK